MPNEQAHSQTLFARAVLACSLQNLCRRSEGWGSSPFLSPGSLVLVDTQEILPAQLHPEMDQLYYRCSVETGHRCGWPITREDTLSLQTMHRDGTWHELLGATSLGVPCGTYWSQEPLEEHDFWLEDHRDRWTMNYIRSVRRKFLPKTIQ